jgi:hypothetical protein
MKTMAWGFAALMLSLAAPESRAAEKYFGYFGGDYPSVGSTPDLHEFHDHANLYSIQFWSGTSDNMAASENYVLGELERARQFHIHAMVPAWPFVFQHALGEKAYHLDPNAAAHWNAFVQKMLDRGLLIPGDPDRSVVNSIYLIDEPNGDAALNDVSGAPNPALAAAVSAIRGNSATAGVPIASILTADFGKISQGIKLLDWVGFDRYGQSTSDWTNTLNSLEGVYAPGKKYIIVPGSLDNCREVTQDDPKRFIDRMDSDPNVVWLAPFMWQTSGSCKGVRDLPTLRAAYLPEGKKIKATQCAASASWFCGFPPDLYWIKPTDTASGKTEVHVLDASTGYSTYKLHAVTAYPTANTDQVSFALGDANGDGKTDLYLISRYNNGTPNIEVHILDGATNYSTYVAHYSTILPAVDGGLAWTFDVADYNRDGIPDLFVFKKVGGNTGRTEVHIYNGADGFQTALGHFPMPMPPTGSDDAWEYHAADFDGDDIPDVFAIAKQNGSTTEVHVVTAASNYATYTLETPTALHTTGTDSRWVFGVNDYDHDGQPDVFAMTKAGATGTEVHILKGIGYQQFELHTATPIPALATDNSQTLLINK